MMVHFIMQLHFVATHRMDNLLVGWSVGCGRLLFALQILFYLYKQNKLQKTCLKKIAWFANFRSKRPIYDPIWLNRGLCDTFK